MNKRDFIKSSLFAGIGLMSFSEASGSQKPKKSAGYKNWVWENPTAVRKFPRKVIFKD